MAKDIKDYLTDDWEQMAKDYGVYDQFSPYQLEIAKTDPNYGYGLGSAKIMYAQAATPEEKAKAHSLAEELNASYGFSGGTDGSLVITRPTQQAQNAARDAYTGYGDFSYSRDPDYRAALAKVTNPDPFSYDYKSDPNYQAYAKQYTREGRRASEDTLGQYAAMTGGRPSTAAVTASQQAGNYYASQLADKIPELYKQKYQQYLDEFSQRLQGLNALRSDRNFEYGVYGDKYNRLGDAYDIAAGENATSRAEVQNQEQTAHSREQAALDRLAANEKNEWQKYLEEWEMQNTDKKNAMSEADWRASRGQYDQMAELLGMSVDEVKSRYEQPITSGYSSPGGSGSTTTDFYDAAAGLRKAGITNETEAKRWLMREYPGMSEKEAKAYAADYLAIYGETPAPEDPYHGYSESDYNWARSVIDSASKGDYDTSSPGYAMAKEIMSANGMKFPEGSDDGVDNSGTKHRNGQLKSKDFDNVMSEVSTMYRSGERGGQAAKIDNIKFKLRNAVEQRRIHEYEIDLILDSLGL